MSIAIDHEFARLLSGRLRNFKKKDRNLYNFSCPFCGDSQKNKNKARGYLYRSKNSLSYKCHNCGKSCNLANLIKEVDASLHKRYIMERFSSGSTGKKTVEKPAFPEMIYDKPKFKETTLLDKMLPTLASLPDDHFAVNFVRNRKIPEKMLQELYFIDDISRVGQLNPKYAERIKYTEPRLVIPIRNRQGKLIALECRAFGDVNPRIKYMTIKLAEDETYVYGIDQVDFSKTIYVLEGPIDSMFLHNAVAVGNSDLRIPFKRRMLPKETSILIFDNQPRNKEITRHVVGSANQGYNIVIWPESIDGKDINDLVLAGFSEKEILDIINNNNYSGPQAVLAATNWRKSS